MAMAVEQPVFFPELRNKATITIGDESRQKAVELFQQMGLPGGLLPLEDIVESGHVEETGFVWMVTRRAQQHHFKKADRSCHYDELVTSTISPNSMSNIVGVKAQDIANIWVPINHILLEPASPANNNTPTLVFKSLMGLSRSYPAHLFEAE